MTLATWVQEHPQAGQGSQSRRLVWSWTSADTPVGSLSRFHHISTGGTATPGRMGCCFFLQVDSCLSILKGPEQGFPARALSLSHTKPTWGHGAALPKTTPGYAPCLSLALLPPLQNPKSDQLPFYHRYLHTLHILFRWFLGSCSLQDCNLLTSELLLWETTVLAAWELSPFKGLSPHGLGTDPL